MVVDGGCGGHRCHGRRGRRRCHRRYHCTHTPHPSHSCTLYLSETSSVRRNCRAMYKVAIKRFFSGCFSPSEQVIWGGASGMEMEREGKEANFWGREGICTAAARG